MFLILGKLLYLHHTQYSVSSEKFEMTIRPYLYIVIICAQGDLTAKNKNRFIFTHFK